MKLAYSKRLTEHRIGTVRDSCPYPDVDFTSMLMEEENILYEHETTLSMVRINHGTDRGKLTDCATVEKKPLRILAAMKESKLAAPVHQAAVHTVVRVNQN